MCANQASSSQGERTDPEALTFVWGMTPLPISDTPANFFVTGAHGSGKTLTLRLLLRSVLGHIRSGFDHRAIVFDPTGAIGSWLRGMGLRCPVDFLDPSNRGGVAWDIAADIDSPAAAHQLAGVLIPEERSGNLFFVDAARQVLWAACLGLIHRGSGRWTLRDLVLATESRKRLLSLLAQVPQTDAAAQCLGDEGTSANILTTIATKLHPLEAVAANWQDTANKFSLQRWLRDGRLTVLGTSFQLGDGFAVLNRAVFNRLADLILSQKESSDRRTWIFMDDFCQAGRLDRLASLLQAGPSEGTCVVLSFRDMEEIRRVYDSHVAEEFVGNCTHKTALRTRSAEAAAWSEQHFGPPLRAADLMALPPPGPEHGLTAFHHTPRAGTYLASKSWEWVLANIQPPKDASP